MEIVLDASIAVKWFSARAEDNVEIALEMQRQKISNNLEIIVTDLFYLEIVNAFLSRSRFGVEDIFMIEEALHKMNLKVIYPDHAILNSAIRIAHACNLTIYDSFYIAAAEFFKKALFFMGKKKIIDKKISKQTGSEVREEDLAESKETGDIQSQTAEQTSISWLCTDIITPPLPFGSFDTVQLDFTQPGYAAEWFVSPGAFNMPQEVLISLQGDLLVHSVRSGILFSVSVNGSVS